jgi:PTH1 family peptidyl-tRNA hydrolase
LNVIVGLGNPGHTFQHTRHNVGFMVVQRLAERHGVRIEHRVVDPTDQRPAAVYGDYVEGEARVRLLMPLTMMNESGEALRATALSPRAMLIVCDDVNLPLGTLRLRAEGSSGGHHGLQSCLDVLGTERVARLRVGVAPAELPKDLTEFVLLPFRSTERPLMKESVEQAADACEVWAKEGIEVAMNRYNKARKAS